MTILEALILGIVQGITEFLPVSSSGHLVLLQSFFGVESNVILFSVVVHAATLVAVVMVMWKEIYTMLRQPFSPDTLKLMLACVPTVIIVIAFEGFFRASFKGAYLGWGFMISAVFLTVTDLVTPRPKAVAPLTPRLDSVTKSNAVVMGIAQGIAVMPGISRSGATICTGLIMGGNRGDVSRLSFLMSIPIILGATIFEAVDIGVSAVQVDIMPLIVGALAALVSGYLAVNFMLRIIRKSRFWGFGVYLAIMSVMSFVVTG